MSEEKKLNVLCSPLTFRRIEADKNYREQVTQHVTDGEDFDEVIFSQKGDPQQSNDNFDQQVSPQSGTLDAIDSPVAVSCETNEFSNADVLEDQKRVWLDSTIRFLISRVKDLRPKVGKSINLKNKKQMWAKIAEEMCAKGDVFNAQQVEAKYFSLERQYKKMRLNNSKTGRSRQTCPYQKELDDLFIERKSVNPEYTLSSEQEVTPKDVCNFDERDNLDTSSSEALDVTPSTSRKRKTVLEQYLEKAEEHAAKREKHDLMLQKMLEESIKKKEERAQRKEQLEERKIELLEKLLNFVSK